LDIAFLINDQQKPHEGVVRPFLNFAKALESKYTLSFLLLNCSSDFNEYLQKSKFQVIVAKNRAHLIEEVQRLKPKFIFTDDDLKRLKIALEIKQATKTRIISYVQILYGSHTIANCFDLSSLTLKQKLIFSSLRYMPFSFFRNRYAKLLNSSDLVVANSKVTATFLHSLYDVEVDEIIYPPIDTDLFQPRDQKVRREITLYLGSHLGDSRQDFIYKIIEKATKDGYLVNIFGNRKIASIIKSMGNNLISFKPDLTDVELAKMYSRSKITICPQKWEQFGLVPVESISCGTPVLAFNCMGFQETITASTGWLANNDADFLQILDSQLKKDEIALFSPEDLRNTVTKDFSIAASEASLQKLLEKYFN
jgi:glycosyltransferase involved in cell wall biosynthesis